LGVAEDLDVFEGALADVVEAGLISMEEAELGCGGQVGESAGNAAEFVAGLVGGHGVIVETGFDGPGAAQTPEGGDHFLDDAELDVVDGAVALDVLVEEDFEVLAAFVGQDDAVGEKAVADGVEGRSLFSRGCGGAAGAGTVGAGRENSFERRHSYLRCHIILRAPEKRRAGHGTIKEKVA
jgi:hypothetical protein